MAKFNLRPDADWHISYKGMSGNNQGLPKVWEGNGLIGRTSVLLRNEFMTREVVGLLSEVSCNSVKPTEMIAWQKNIFLEKSWKRHSSIKLLKDTFEWTNSNEIKHSKR